MRIAQLDVHFEPGIRLETFKLFAPALDVGHKGFHDIKKLHGVGDCLWDVSDKEYLVLLMNNYPTSKHMYISGRKYIRAVGMPYEGQVVSNQREEGEKMKREKHVQTLCWSLMMPPYLSSMDWRRRRCSLLVEQTLLSL